MGRRRSRATRDSRVVIGAAEDGDRSASGDRGELNRIHERIARTSADDVRTRGRAAASAGSRENDRVGSRASDATGREARGRTARQIGKGRGHLGSRGAARRSNVGDASDGDRLARGHSRERNRIHFGRSRLGGRIVGLRERRRLIDGHRCGHTSRTVNRNSSFRHRAIGAHARSDRAGSILCHGNGGAARDGNCASGAIRRLISVALDGGDKRHCACRSESARATDRYGVRVGARGVRRVIQRHRSAARDAGGNRALIGIRGGDSTRRLAQVEAARRGDILRRTTHDRHLAGEVGHVNGLRCTGREEDRAVGLHHVHSIQTRDVTGGSIKRRQCGANATGRREIKNLDVLDGNTGVDNRGAIDIVDREGVGATGAIDIVQTGQGRNASSGARGGIDRIIARRAGYRVHTSGQRERLDRRSDSVGAREGNGGGGRLRRKISRTAGRNRGIGPRHEVQRIPVGTRVVDRFAIRLGQIAALHVNGAELRVGAEGKGGGRSASRIDITDADEILHLNTSCRDTHNAGVSTEFNVAGKNGAEGRAVRSDRIRYDRNTSDVSGVITTGVCGVEQVRIDRGTAANREDVDVRSRVGIRDRDGRETLDVGNASLVVFRRRNAGLITVGHRNGESARARKLGLDDVTLHVEE